MVSFLVRHDAPDLAYVHVLPDPVHGGRIAADVAVLFLGGFKSDMEGTKALYLEEACRSSGREFIRFDYSGHGKSQGRFEDGTIGAWLNDARAIMDLIIAEKVIVAGSSMGGWIALKLLQDDTSGRLAGLVGIAAAPDFTDDIEAGMTDAQKVDMEKNGFISVGHNYGDDPYIFTHDLLRDGAQNRVLRRITHSNVPVLLIHGKQDLSVHWNKAEAIKAVFKGPDTRVHYVDDGDHRLSRPQDLQLIWDCVCEIGA